MQQATALDVYNHEAISSEAKAGQQYGEKLVHYKQLSSKMTVDKKGIPTPGSPAQPHQSPRPEDRSVDEAICVHLVQARASSTIALKTQHESAYSLQPSY